jgi:hypothetical protein
MSATIVVSLITATSTLTAVAISGCIAFLVGRTQARTQVEITRNQLVNKQWVEKREIKKGVYLNFVSQMGAVETALWDLGRPTPEAVSSDEFERLIRSLDNAIADLRYQNYLVTIEGSTNSAAVAQRAYELLRDRAEELMMAARTWYETGFGGTHDLTPKEDEYRPVVALKNDFIVAVKESLDEPLAD